MELLSAHNCMHVHGWMWTRCAQWRSHCAFERDIPDVDHWGPFSWSQSQHHWAFIRTQPSLHPRRWQEMNEWISEWICEWVWLVFQPAKEWMHEIHSESRQRRTQEQVGGEKSQSRSHNLHILTGIPLSPVQRRKYSSPAKHSGSGRLWAI